MIDERHKYRAWQRMRRHSEYGLDGEGMIVGLVIGHPGPALPKHPMYKFVRDGDILELLTCENELTPIELKPEGTEPMRRIRETKLLQALHFRGMTARKLAQKVGTSQSAMGRYVSGAREPKVKLAQRIADELGCGVNEVFPPGASR